LVVTPDEPGMDWGAARSQNWEEKLPFGERENSRREEKGEKSLLGLYSKGPVTTPETAPKLEKHDRRDL